MKKKITKAFITCFISMFVLGGIWNALIMEGFYISHSPSNLLAPEEFSLPFIALGYLVLTAIMTLIVVQNFDQNPKFVGGFMFGATFGLAATLPLYLILYGRWEISMAYILVDSAWHLVEQGIGGAVLCSIIYSKNKKYNE